MVRALFDGVDNYEYLLKTETDIKIELLEEKLKHINFEYDNNKINENTIFNDWDKNYGITMKHLYKSENYEKESTELHKKLKEKLEKDLLNVSKLRLEQYNTYMIKRLGIEKLINEEKNICNVELIIIIKKFEENLKKGE